MKEILKGLTKKQIIERLLYFYETSDIQTINNEFSDNYMMGIIGNSQRTLLNRLKIIMNYSIPTSKEFLENLNK